MKKLLKHGIIALSTALLAAAMIVSCPPPIGELDGTPTGSGLTITINRNVEKPDQFRTLKPTTVLGDFASFKLTLAVNTTTPNGADLTGVTNPIYVNAPFSSTSISLRPGNYTVSVVGYMDAYTAPTAPTKPAAATKTAVPVAISEGASTPITITLTAFNDPANSADGDGTFSWNIDLAAVTILNTATLQIIPISAGGTATSTTNLRTPGNADNTATGITLKPGQYRALLEAAKTDSNTFYLAEIVYVYSNMTTQPFVFPVADFMFSTTPPPAAFVVTFDSKSGSAVSPLSCGPDNKLAALPTPPTRSGFTFLGWWDTDGSGDDNWGTQIDTDYLFSADATVFARWIQNGGIGGTLELEDPIGGTAIVLNNGTIAYGSPVVADVNDTLTITMTNFSLFNAVEWKSGSATIGTGGSITLNNTTTPGTASVGQFLIFVTTSATNGQHQAFWFTVEVQ